MGRPPVPAARRRRIDATIAQLRALLPPDWSVDDVGQRGDVTLLRIADAGRTEGAVPLLTTDRLEPREVRGMWLPPDESTLVSAGWLSDAFARSPPRAPGQLHRSNRQRQTSACRAPVSTFAPKAPTVTPIRDRRRHPRCEDHGRGHCSERSPRSGRPTPLAIWQAPWISMTGTSRGCCRCSPTSSSSNALLAGR